jgi:hypothetical protein
MEEVVRNKLRKKEENCKDLEYEIVSLRKELEKTTIKLDRSLKFEKSTEILDDIINFQIYPFIKTSLGYDVDISSLPTTSLATSEGVLFFAGGVWTGFPKEQAIVDCAEIIDVLHVPHIAEFEHTYNIVVDWVVLLL